MTTVSTLLGPMYVDDQGKADEPVALLWPSLFSDHRMWRHQIAALRDSGWRTLALDPPGHGRSPGPGRSFTLDECAEAAVQILDASGVRAPVVLLGTSWGGFVAPRIALRAPHRVKGLVLFNTSAEGSGPVERIRGRLLMMMLGIGTLRRPIDRLLVSAMLAANTRSGLPQTGADLAAHLGEWDRRGVIAAVRSVLVRRDSILDALPAVSAPALIVSGREDKILPPLHSGRMAAKLPNARHVEVPEAAHLVPLEQPQTANALILDFVRQSHRQSR